MSTTRLTAIPSLHAVHCFDVAARVGSFTAAARELHLTHGAISRQVRLLETELGARLFTRGARHVALTADGATLARSTERMFATLSDGLAALERRRGGPLVVSCEPTLTQHWLIPRLGRFAGALAIESRGGAIDFAHAGVDVAIRRADFPIASGGVVALPFMDEWLGPVCAPDYARTLGRRSPRANLLHTRTRLHAFRDWSALGGRAIGARSEQTFDHFALSLQAAIAGLGVAIGPYPLVAEAIAAGRLVAPLGFVRGAIGYVLLAPRAFDDDARTSALRDWLVAEGATTRPSALGARLRTNRDSKRRLRPIG